jgi:hypothetical protein
LPEEADPSDPEISITVAYLVVYRLPVPIPEDIAAVSIPAFASLNAPLTCWPYIRQMLSCLTAEMGLLIQPLPLLMVKPEDQRSGPAVD